MKTQRSSAREVEEFLRAERRSVSWLAKGVLPNINTAIDCEVLNVSDAGAKIQLIEVDFLPYKFKLFVPQIYTLYECRLVWKKQRLAGIAFENRVNLKTN